MNAFAKQQEDSLEQREEKKQRLKARQEKLSELFKSETKSLETELKQLRINSAASVNPIGTGNIGVPGTTGETSSRINSSRANETGSRIGFNSPVPQVQFNSVDALKQRAENLRSAREDERKKLAEEKLYEHWRMNNPEIREIESKKFNNYVVSNWENQISERHEQVNKEKLMDHEYVKYLEQEREKELEKDIELKRLKLSRELELKEILKQQMIELKQREAENEILSREEYDLALERAEMQRLEEERIENEKKFESKEYGRQLLRQHTAKLRKKAKEIQESLEYDLKLLQHLNETQDKQRNIDAAKRAKAKADAEYMIKVLQDQLRLEKEREAELDSMFQDEAAREWEKRNAEWERERVAREKLMKEVLDERKKQIDDKYEIIRLKKIESLERREELIKDMEMTQRLAQREKDKLEKAKIERKLDLQSQVRKIKKTFLSSVFCFMFLFFTIYR